MVRTVLMVLGNQLQGTVDSYDTNPF